MRVRAVANSSFAIFWFNSAIFLSRSSIWCSYASLMPSSMWIASCFSTSLALAYSSLISVSCLTLFVTCSFSTVSSKSYFYCSNNVLNFSCSHLSVSNSKLDCWYNFSTSSNLLLNYSFLSSRVSLIALC